MSEMTIFYTAVHQQMRLRSRQLSTESRKNPCRQQARFLKGFLPARFTRSLAPSPISPVLLFGCQKSITSPFASGGEWPFDGLSGILEAMRTPLLSPGNGQRGVAGRDVVLGAGLAILFGLATWGLLTLRSGEAPVALADGGPAIALPRPVTEGGPSLSEALLRRRTVRTLASGTIALADLGRLLWAAQGVTSPDGFRTAPSAGGLFPLELFVVAAGVDGLPAGIYRYRPAGHALQRVGDGDPRPALAHAAWDQPWLAQGPVLVVIAGVQERTARKYGERAFRYLCLEAGHAAQNLLLAAAGDRIPTALVGAFDDAQVRSLLGLPADHTPLYLIPLGPRAG